MPAVAGGIEEAPNDGQVYGRKQEAWTIIDIPEAAPMELTAELAVSGEGNVEVEWGQTLRAVPTVIGGAQPVRITYQWWNDFGVIISDISIPGATNATYEIPETKIGYSIWCKVTATDALGVTEEANTNRCIVTGQASPDLDGNGIGDLGDVNLDGIENDYILVWNEAANEWQVEPKPEGESYWTEESGKLYPATLTNNVQIGGTAADPNITLNASDGSALFKGEVKSPAGFSSRVDTSSGLPGPTKSGMFLGDSTLRISTSSDSPGSHTLLALNSTTLNDEVVRIAADGSGTFAGKVTAADYDLEALPPLSTAP